MSEINIGAALARIDEQLSQVRSSIATLQVSVSGNGKPESGLLQRTASIEQASKACQERFNLIVGRHDGDIAEIKEIANKTMLTKQEIRGKFWLEFLKTAGIMAVLAMQFINK